MPAKETTKLAKIIPSLVAVAMIYIITKLPLDPERR